MTWWKSKPPPSHGAPTEPTRRAMAFDRLVSRSPQLVGETSITNSQALIAIIEWLSEIEARLDAKDSDK